MEILRRITIGVLGIVFIAVAAWASAPQQPAKTEFFLHHKHVGELSLDCTTCHLTKGPQSVVMQRPGHDQCMACHSEAFEKKDNAKICAQCHTGSVSTASKADL